MTEYCIANDEGVIEDGFYSWQEAETKSKEISDGKVYPRELYDEDGLWVEEEE